MKVLDGQVAIVTGAGAGLGHAIAAALAGAGASVALLDISSQATREAAAAIADNWKVRTLPVDADVSNEDQVAQAFTRVTSDLGVVSILVNNAGIMAPRLTRADDMTIREFDTMLAVHVRGTFLMCRQAIPVMARAGFGRIINQSSVLGLVGSPLRAAYSLAKSGLISLTRTLAIENARKGITVNAIAPGYILTDTLKQRVERGILDHDRFAERTPVGRWGMPNDVARVVVFLAERASAYITGTVIPVDGGYSIRGDAGDDIGPRPA